MRNQCIMEKNDLLYYKEIIFASSDQTEIRRNQKLLLNGQIRKIAPKIYSANLTDSPEEIIRRNIFEILGHMYPGAILSHRSALEYKPTSANYIFVTYTYTKKIKLPGITISFLKGHPPLSGDKKFIGSLHVSQYERALLENLMISKKPGPRSKTLSIPEIEENLEKIIRVKGEASLNAIRDHANEISKQLGLEKEFGMLNKIISALLSTKPAKGLKSKIALARALGSPYDPERVKLFASLFSYLSSEVFPDRPDKNSDNKSFRNFAFFESYFSNYIEGTKFEISEAKNIIESGMPLLNRTDDSHDILGTYQLTSSKPNISIIPDSAEHFIELLLTRHKILLSGRQQLLPGEFKDKNNRAGSTYFVDYTLVKGTLIKGFNYYSALKDPFARASYIMFLISEVHPFNDGNGRTARIFMNAEFVANGQSKIIIPTVFREDYLLALKKLSKKGDPIPYMKMLDRAHRFSETIYGKNIDKMQEYLEKCNAFKEPDEGFKLKF